MDRKFSVRYRRATSEHEHGDQEQNRSMNMYDRDTDNNIFALGDAAQGEDFNSQLDDIFHNFGISLGDAFGHTQIVSDQSTIQSPISPPEGAMGAMTTTSFHPPGAGGGVQQDVQVSTIMKTLPDGRMVQTRVFRGPVQTRKRIMKISRELPGGKTELLGTFEGDENLDISQALTKALSQTSLSTHGSVAGSQVAGVGPSETSSERNRQDTSPAPPSVPNQEQHVPADVSYAGATLQDMPQITRPKLPPLRQFHPSPLILNSTGPPQPSLPSKVTFQDRTQDTSPIPSSGTPTHSPPCRHNAFRFSGKCESVISDGSRKSFAADEAIQMYQPDDIMQELQVVEEEKAVCPCCPKLWTHRKHHLSHSGSDQFKGRLGMTQSEINADAKPLPSLQALVGNYARMLHEDKHAFRQTMFRAVKLDKLDVVKILCKIVTKSGLKLSSNELREPESSATILHVALLYNHKDIVQYLVARKESDLIMAKYENEQYLNQTALHVAVANGNLAVVESLLLALDVADRVELINTIANGKYFIHQHPHGQLCLSGAAWAGNGEIIKLLVDQGGNMVLKNQKGNTLLHSLILQSSQYPNRNIYESLFMAVWDATGIWAEQMVYESRNEAQRHLEKAQMQIDLFKELLAIRNNNGYTIIALACTMGSKLFKFLLNFEKIYKIPQNRLGSITWVTYDVTDITSFAYGNYNKFSILHILAHKSQQLSRHANIEDMEDYLEMEPLKALHTCKWRVYRVIYIMWMAIHVSYMIIFTACTVETNSSPINRTALTQDNIANTQVQYGFAFFLILPVMYIILEILDLFGNKPYRVQFMSGNNYIVRGLKCIYSEWTISGNGPYRLVNMGFSYFVIQWFLLYMFNNENQDIALALSLLLGWVFVLFFTRGCRVTCRFTIMIQKMFFRDLIYFLTVYGLILIGFSFAMNAMFTHQHNAETTISEVFYDMMNVVTDLDKKQKIDQARHQLFSKLLLIFYAIVAVILLMNMLIAMMNTSYETIRVTRVNLWKQQQLSIMLMMERRIFWLKWLCQKSEQDIWRKDDDEEMRCYLDVTVLHTSSYSIN